MKGGWLNKNIFFLSFSAFFADLGYQAVLVLFPIYIVLELKYPIYVYGIITALSFGVGSLFSYVGGRLGDRLNKKYLVIFGNLFIPLMSLSVLFHSIWIISLLYILGWWARYFRTPARRVLVSESSNEEHRSKVFGFLNLLDIGGGVLAILYTVLLLHLNVPMNDIILVTIIPLVISTILLLFVKEIKNGFVKVTKVSSGININKVILISIFIATLFYGFSYFNFGFPVLTIVYTAHLYILAVLAYGVYLLTSALSGYVFGSIKIDPIKAIWLLGYFLSALGALLIGLIYLLGLSFIFYYFAVLILGIGMGSVETYEPTLISLISQDRKSTNMGYLSMFRSIGLFVSNIVVGLIFMVSQSDAYFYAFLSAMIASLIVFRVSRLKASRLEK
jgi:MFS family permease